MLDPYARPPNFIRQFYKRFQKLKTSSIAAYDNEEICDFLHAKEDALEHFVEKEESLDAQEIADAFDSFLYHDSDGLFNVRRQNYEKEPPRKKTGEQSTRAKGLQLKVYESKELPGLQIIPSVLPIPLQRALLSRTLHGYLSNPQHNNNANLHHRVSLPYQYSSYFDIPPSEVGQSKDAKTNDSTKTIYVARNPNLHPPLSHTDFLNKRLRWATLGAQYDWTRKVYPSDNPSDVTSTPSDTPVSGQSPAQSSTQQRPSIPADVANLLKALYPPMRPDAAIVNVYSPGDVLGVHRDVSEESEVGLVSISLGCEAVFIVGLNALSEDDADSAGNDCAKVKTKDADADATAAVQHDEKEQKGGVSGVVALRLRSGDVVIMSGASRWAWHGVPAVLPGTCPIELADWPARMREDIESHSRYESDLGIDVAANNSYEPQVREQGGFEADKCSQGPREPYQAWKGWMATKRVNLNVRQL